MGSRGAQDLIVVGTGTLGTLAGKQWAEVHPGALVAGETRSEARHDSLRAVGIEPRLRAVAGSADAESFSNVLICFAPGGNEDFPGEVRRALEMWDGSGGCVFTSSGGVYAENDGGTVREDSETADTPRSARLLQAERHVLEKGGTVLRLAGLYTCERGAHNYWLSQERIDQWAGGLINLLHYEDAASGAVAALRAKVGAKILLLSDDQPMTRGEIVHAALQASLYAGKRAPEFTQASGPKGKVYDTALTRSLIDWKPTYPTFEAHMQST
jgi:hypothetical protein